MNVKTFIPWKRLIQQCALFFVFICTSTLGSTLYKSDSIKENKSIQLVFQKDYGTSKTSLERGNWAAKEINRDTSWLKIGGALRLNAIYSFYEGQTFPLGTASRNEWTWDTWRINVDSYADGLQFSFEYRFYPTFNTHFIKYGWIGYRFNPEWNLQMGISQVPFGLLTYASHSWWFQAPYYLGLEDDHQMGFNLSYTPDKWTFNFAYFPLSEPRGTNDPDFGAYSSARYSYDVVPIPGESNIERNQLNLRATYQLGNTQLGTSTQWMEIYNQSTANKGNQIAGAIHAEWQQNRWNLKTEIIYYKYNKVKNDDGTLLSSLQMGAYGFGTYDVASEASLYLIGLAYDIPTNWGPISNIQIYNDYTYIHKPGKINLGNELFPFRKTQQNVLGALITAGKIYTYVDIASGYNHPWISDSFGGHALGTGRGIQYDLPISETNPIDPKPGWNTRLNINLGYYF
ncbi:OprO/OprP family phosphate-selective porin [Echinicola marina]|uniref:porin n=1 Tax=Echinicola marina TaxID=2859768 RepID=UPI001CF64486|nr:porin [Echinicola marina]UCS94236.1 OprO/OprP family phosphate-selective porin [Echinicola marina]